MAGASPARALQAFTRRQSRARARIQWFDQQFMQDMNITLERRLDMIAQLLRDKIVANLSLPVERSGRTVVKRSLVGEFPRAETTRLMRDIFWNENGRLRRTVGTSLDYGLHLELKGRSFLRRTLEEEQPFITGLVLRRLN